mgnify:CR=1 FL=1
MLFLRQDKRHSDVAERQEKMRTDWRNRTHPKGGSEKSLVHRLWKQRGMQAMVLPGVILLFLFSYLPMYGVLIAFKDYRIINTVWNAPWASNGGFEHFIRFFSDGNLLRVVRNTLTLSISSLLITFPIPIAFALLLNEIRMPRLKRSIQTMTYFPHFLSWVVMGGIVISWLSEGGLINDVLKAAGIIEKDIVFLAKPELFYPIVIITNIWKETGWSAIIYLAAITGVDPELYESATIDGAGRLKKAWYITLPCIKGTVVLMLIMQIAYLFGNNFDQILVLRNSLNQEVSDVIDIFVYRQGLQGQNYSYATAIGLFRSVINVILLFSANTFAKKYADTSIF